jgi:EmrB/QacA subfamily drug resistance transporter
MPSLSQLRKQDASPAFVLTIVCAGVILASLDLFIVNVALPTIARDLHVSSLGSLSWVLNAYAIVYASLLVLFGRLSEGRSRQNGFLIGVLVFTLASAACGLSTSLAMLIVFRVVQAAGAALLTPTSISLILATAPPEKRQRSIRTWTALGGAAAALGPVAGGLLVAVSWRWIFFVNVPIGLAAAVIGWLRLPNVPGHPVKRPDALGAVLITAAVGLLSLALVQGNDWGWGSPRTIAALAATVALLAGFVLRLLRHDNPLIEPSLFRNRAFTGSSVAVLVFNIAFGSMLLSIVLWEQQVWGWSALRTGLAIAPGPLVVPFFAFLLTGRLIARWGPGPVIGLGATVYTAGIVWWIVRAGLHPDYVAQVLPGSLLTGAGVGLTLPTIMSTGTSTLPPQALATGPAAINMLRPVGVAVGVSILVAVIGTPSSGDAALHAFRAGWTVIAAFSLLTALTAPLLLARVGPARKKRSAARGVGAGTDNDNDSIAREITSRGPMSVEASVGKKKRAAFGGPVADHFRARRVSR